MLAQIARRKMTYKVFMSTWIVIVYAEIPNTGFTHIIHIHNTWLCITAKKTRFSETHDSDLRRK